jgi:membrane protein DedA with SNARE-associated domain
MNAIVQFVMAHGYFILFAALFANQIGFPIPGALFIVAAGALAAAHKMDAVPALALVVAACVLADWIWYEAARRNGDRVLHFIHRFLPDPGDADRKAREAFDRFGPPVLLLAKFVPGLDAIVPPLAGVSGTSRHRFLIFDAIGAILWSVANGGLGYLLSHNLDRAAAYIARVGTFLASLVFIALAVYVASRLFRWACARAASYAVVPAKPMGCAASVADQSR